MTLHPSHVIELTRTWKLVTPVAPQAMARFYATLFRIAPQAQAHFAGLDMQAQQAKLAAALSLVVRDAGNLPKLVPALHALGARHAALDVGPADYDAVGQALIQTLAEMLGDAFTPAARAAWTQAYASVAGTMMQGAATAGAMSA